MKIRYIGPPDQTVAIDGIGVVTPGDVVDAPEHTAQNLIREGRATLPPKTKDKPAPQPEDTKEK